MSTTQLLFSTLLITLTHCFVDVALPDLNYRTHSLEPIMDEETVKVHHGGHFAGYTKKLNEALKEIHQKAPGVLPEDLVDIARNYNRLVNKLKKKVENGAIFKLRTNLGGFLAHDMFFKGLTPLASKHNDEWFGLGDDLRKALTKSFGHIEDFQNNLFDEVEHFFGAGWLWLVMDLKSGELMIMQTKDQDTPYVAEMEPILNVDLWEHAYFLKYKYDNQKWVEECWKLLNWEQATINYQLAEHKRREMYPPTSTEGEL